MLRNITNMAHEKAVLVAVRAACLVAMTAIAAPPCFRPP
jgi:hypothetical protein